MNDDKNLNLKYKFNTKCNDLVCDMTDFMDKYILFNNLEKNIKYSYIYNDLSTFSTKTRRVLSGTLSITSAKSFAFLSFFICLANRTLGYASCTVTLING